jgi:anti-anti-sigma factor
MMRAPGSIETERHGDVTVLILVGDHDIANVAAVREALASGVSSGGGLVVSLMRTEYIDSGVVNALFHTNQQLRLRGRELVLHVNTASIVRRVLDVSGLAAHVACDTSMDDAVAIAKRVR